MPVTVPQTYPGTVTPLRGLLAFGESDRDVLFGRDRERDELTRLVVGDAFRAGLLFGEEGVGKTSLLRAGLLPHLRDQGVFALVCDDLSDPVRSFANALLAETGVGAQDGESAIQYLARVVSEALKGQLYLFVVDGLERVLDTSDEVLGAYANLYAQVVSRSGGRARFLFSCAAKKVYALGALERKTGSLFPPSNRYELRPFDPQTATEVLDRTIALAGLNCDPNMAATLATALTRKQQVLPADLQIAALAIRDLGLATPNHLQAIGGAAELLRAWLLNAAAATGDERAALRIVGELAHGDGLNPCAAGWLASRANVEPAFAQHALTSLQASVVVQSVVVPGESERHFSLAHSILAAPAREIAAPAREAARIAFELLGSKAESNGRLELREWIQLRRDGISPSSEDETAVLERTKRYFYTVFGAIGAAPIVLLIFLYILLAGHYYLDVGRPSGGGKQTVVVRKGRPGLSAFFWLPAWPGYGEIIADTGFTRAMLGDKAWERVGDTDISGSNDGMAYVDAAMATVEPTVAARIRYATSGSPEELATLVSAAETPDAKATLLTQLAPIARGSAEELAFVQESLGAPEPSVQTAAMSVITEGARRNPKAFGKALVGALSSSDAELRRLAIAAARGLGDELSGKLVTKALAESEDAGARRDLMAIAGTATDGGPSASAAAASLRDRSASSAAQTRARAELERAFRTDTEAAVAAAAALATDADAPPEQRAFALELLYELAPESAYPDLKAAATECKGSKSEPVEAAALPLYARVDPTGAAGDLVMLGNRKLSTELRRAVALAWGEVARKDRRPAEAALEPMLADPNPVVRSAAARAIGNAGRSGQAKLVSMVQKERYDVAIGAAYGLANSAEVGASAGVAVGGIYQLWKRKGKPRREAAEVYAKLARNKPAAVFNYIVAAARARDDRELNPIGARGLCNAHEAGYRRAARELERSASDDSVEVRRLVAQCLVDSKVELGKSETDVAVALSRDSDANIRSDAARVLARAVANKPPAGAVAALAKLAQDKSREPRMIAIRALGTVSKAPDGALAALPVAFRGAPESDKLDILRVARKLGAGEVVASAITDESPSVRLAAIDTAIATRTDVASVINAALSDPDPSVRRAALARLAEGKSGLDTATTEAALRLAIRDDNEEIGDLALATMGRVGDPASARAELERRLASPSERVRSQAARASIGLAETDPKSAIEMLAPLLDDPSHDVRVALVPALGKAMALSSPGELAKKLSKAEGHATRRWVALAALLTLAQTEAGEESTRAELSKIAEKGRPWARFAAALGLGLLDGKADGITFLQTLVP